MRIGRIKPQDYRVYDKKIASDLGEAIKQTRLQKNILRESLCEQSGVSLSALRHLEDGGKASILTLIKIMRSLGRESWFSTAAPMASINPLYMLPTGRRRARKSTKS